MTSIRDVARVADVSHQTVSRVINNHPNVSKLTRERVANAIAELDFHPNAAARSLANGNTDAVTVLTAETALYGYAQTVSGIEEAARAAGVGVSILVLESDAAKHVDAAVRQVSDPRTGSVVVVAFDKAGLRVLQALPTSERTAAAAESIVGRKADELSRKRMAWFDDTKAAYLATSHLLQLGHRTVHHLAVPSSTTVSDRERGWKAALAAAGAEKPKPIRMHTWSVAAAYQPAVTLLQDRSVTAVLCGNDDLAVGLMRAAHELGRSIPRDLSVVGFDDIPLAEFLVPSLTTVRFDFVALGRRAFHLLGIDPSGVHTGGTSVTEPTLIVRESSGPARC